MSGEKKGPGAAATADQGQDRNTYEGDGSVDTSMAEIAWNAPEWTERAGDQFDPVEPVRMFSATLTEHEGFYAERYEIQAMRAGNEIATVTERGCSVRVHDSDPIEFFDVASMRLAADRLVEAARVWEASRW